MAGFEEFPIRERKPPAPRWDAVERSHFTPPVREDAWPTFSDKTYDAHDVVRFAERMVERLANGRLRFLVEESLGSAE